MSGVGPVCPACARPLEPDDEEPLAHCYHCGAPLPAPAARAASVVLRGPGEELPSWVHWAVGAAALAILAEAALMLALLLGLEPLLQARFPWAGPLAPAAGVAGVLLVTVGALVVRWRRRWVGRCAAVLHGDRVVLLRRTARLEVPWSEVRGYDASAGAFILLRPVRPQAMPLVLPVPDEEARLRALAALDAAGVPRVDGGAFS